jgi:hypothetical protein
LSDYTTTQRIWDDLWENVMTHFKQLPLFLLKIKTMGDTLVSKSEKYDRLAYVLRSSEKLQWDGMSTLAFDVFEIIGN